MAGLDDILGGDFGAQYKGALEEAQTGRREAMALQKQALEAYQGAINAPRQGGDPALMAFFGALGRPTRTGSFGESLGGAMESYAGALDKQQQASLSKAEKHAHIMGMMAKMHQQNAEARMQDLNQQVDAAQRYAQIQQMQQNNAFTQGMPTLGAVAGGTDGRTAAVEQAGQTGNVTAGSSVAQMPGASPTLPPTSLPMSPFDPNPMMGGAPAAPAAPAAQAAPAAAPALPEGGYKLADDQIARAQHLQKMIQHASQPQFRNVPAAQQALKQAMTELDGLGGEGFGVDVKGGFAYPKGKATPAYQRTVSEAKRAEKPSAIEQDFDQQYIDLMKAGRESVGKVSKYKALGSALESAWTGPGASVTLPARRVLKDTLGIDIGNVPDTEVAQALGNQLALELRNPSSGAGMPGALSDKDREFLQASIANIDKSPAGNKQMIDLAVKVEQRNQEVARMATEYVKKNGRLDARFADIVAAHAEQNPIFVAQSKPGAKSATAETPPMPGAKRAPDGNWYVKQGDKYFRVEQ
jgi:hypothetical protein